MVVRPPKRPHRSKALVALALAAAAVAAAPASAAVEALAVRKPTKAVVLTAQLRATGTGVARIDGSVVAFAQATAPATLVVLDTKGGARVTVGARKLTLRRGRSVTLSVPAGGRLYVEGTAVSMRLTAPGGMTLSAAVKGKGFFDGAGTYLLNGATQPVSWAGALVQVDLQPPSAKPVATAPPAATSTTTTTTTVTQPPAEASPSLVTTSPRTP